MVRKIEVHCPYHGTSESLEVPDEYYNFEGEVACPTSDNILDSDRKALILKVKLAGGKVVSVERVIKPS